MAKSGWRKNIRFIQPTQVDLSLMTKPEQHQYFGKQFLRRRDIRYLKLEPKIPKTSTKKRKISGKVAKRKKTNNLVKEELMQFDAQHPM